MILIFLRKNYFPSDDGSQNKFVYKTKFDTLKLKKKYLILNLSHYILLS